MAHKLLLADDSVTIQRVIDLTFSGEDVDVFAVSDGEQAIARIPTDRPDIVLADIGMPKRSGYDVAAFIKADPALKHIPVLLLAGAFEPVDDARAAAVECDGVLVKPFEPQQVIARVKELLAGKQGTPKPAEERTLPKPIEFPRREESPSAPRPTHDRDSVDAFNLAAPPFASSGTPGQAADESLDEYFDRLDAAFATLTSVPSLGDAEVGRGFDDRLEVPTLDDLLGSDFGASPSPSIDVPLNAPTVTPFMPKSVVAPPAIEPPDTASTRAPAPPARPAEVSAASSSDHVVADAFSALLAFEQGEPGARPVRLTSVAAEPVITDAFIEEVVRRVLERLSPGVMREAIADTVSEVTERLVREEIERIRQR